ncbi:MAG: hypothetical protein J7623_01985 [Chitinophaga sp.]|uniref:hypothetical protein n=1 Tax=Chitinophaga sp. TaxID=1869181 RepID=UPI001B2E5B46|nr:hypothetical protein [Chitinophaga sp.]MBO9727387.1 hypothetical protein [Chitinophaga sp.]
MKYLNPVAVLEEMNGAVVDATDTAAVSLLRKKMMAELELSTDKVLQIKGERWSKNDLLNFFDQLQDSTTLYFHQEINKDPVLSRFLRTGSITGLFIETALYKDKAFLSFIAPFYEPLFTYEVLSSLQRQRIKPLQYLFTNPVLLDGESMKRSYDKIFRFLKQQYRLIEGHKEGLKIHGRDKQTAVGNWISITQIELWNVLPEAFHMERSEYGILLINLALVLYEQGDAGKALTLLANVQQLKSVAYVQENAVRYITYIKEGGGGAPKFRREPTTAFGKLLAKWGLTRERLIQIGTTVFTVLVIMIGSQFEKKEGPRQFAAAENNVFSSSRTYWTMEYLLSQLSVNLYAPKEGVEKHPVLKSLTTGEDVYGPAFMEALSHQGRVGESFVQPLFDHSKPPVPEDSAWRDVRHSHHLLVFNRQKSGLIVLVQTPDSFYSRFVSPQDSAFMPLPLLLSKVFFYVGDLWNPDWEGYKHMDYVPDYTVKGLFMQPARDHDLFLRNSTLQFLLDPNYWKTSDRYIPVEITVSSEERLVLRLLSGNTNGIQLKVGE